MPRSRTVLVFFVGLTCVSEAVLATETEGTTPVYVLGDTVEVKSDRLPELVRDTPMATSVVGAQVWRDGRAAGLDEALRTVPGMLAQSRSGGQDVRITMRGFGARGAGDRSNSGTTRGIRIQLNGFPLTEPDGRTSLDLADLGAIRSVRVVRSNASALYGPAAGGLIDLFTTSPFSSSSFSTRADFGSFGYARQEAQLALTTGASRIRLQGSTSKSDGWREQSASAQTTVQGSVEAELARGTDLSLFVAGTSNLQRQPGALTREEFEADPRGGAPTYVEQNSRRNNRIGRMAARLDRRLDGGASFQVSGFVEPKSLHRSERNRYRDFQRVHTGGSASGTLPLVVSEDLDLRWTSGFDDAYQDGSVLFYDLGPGGSRGPNNIANTREGINTFGVFSELATRLGKRVELSAGARWDFVHYIFEDHQASELDDARTLKRASPRLAFLYRLGEHQSLFASMASGIETPAFNEIDPPAPFDTLTGLNPLLDPAHSLTFEVGARGRLPFGRKNLDRFQYDLAFYTLTVENDIIPFDGGAYYTTAGESRRSGVELALEFTTDYGLLVHASGTYSNNEYVTYENDLGVFDDNETAGIPSTVLDARVRYQHKVGAYTEAEFRRTGTYFANDANTEEVEASNILDATLGYDVKIGGGRSVGAYVAARNLTDETYIGSVFINGVNGRFIEPGLERNVVVGVRLKTGL